MGEYKVNEIETALIQMCETMRNEFEKVILQKSEEKRTETAEAFYQNGENMRTEAAAAFLKVKPSTLEQMRWRGMGPVYCRVGRICIYRRADLEAFLSSHAFNSTTEAQAAKK